LLDREVPIPELRLLNLLFLDGRPIPELRLLN